MHMVGQHRLRVFTRRQFTIRHQPVLLSDYKLSPTARDSHSGGESVTIRYVIHAAVA